MMISFKTIRNNLPKQSIQFGLPAVLDDLLDRAINQKWELNQLLKELATEEYREKAAARNLRRRLSRAQLGRFKPDFDQILPKKKIDRELIEKWLKLTPIAEAKNLILIGNDWFVKTMILKNLAYQAVLAGQSVLYRPIGKLITDLNCGGPLRTRRLREYQHANVLAIDDVDGLRHNSNAGDLLYEVVNCRSGAGSILISTNREFREWNEVLPNATSPMLDRFLLHADVARIEFHCSKYRKSENI